jgi:photosystem II stability/assembly factor-like uncharacterized protein
MKKWAGPVVATAMGALVGIIILNSAPQDGLNTSLAEIPHELRANFKGSPPRGEIHHYFEHLKLVRANQITGQINPFDVLTAREEAYALMRQQGHRALDLQWEPWGPNNVGGRTRAILIDRNNPQRMYAGGVSGGLWLSDNGGESWYPYLDDDTLAGVGVASLCQAANGDIYAGTGEPGQKAGQDSYTTRFMGEGMWKSTDGGHTFFHLPSTKPTNHNSPSHQWSSVVALGAHPTNPDVILAGTERGVMVTEDGGDNWQSLASYGSNPNLLSIFQTSDIKVDQNAIAHICCSGRYFRGDLDDFVFEQMSGGDPGQLPQTFARLMVDFCKADPTHVYVVGCNSGGETTGVYRSTDGGTTWTKISPPSTPNDFFNPTGQQGTYDMWVAVNPADKDRIYICGQLNIWEWTATKGWYPISETSGNTGSNPYRVHADQHVITFHPSDPDVMFVGCDGGVYRSLNALAEYPEIPTWKVLNKGYQVTQFFNVAGGMNGEAMSGTQDNGTVLVDFSGNSFLEGRIINGGDGGFAEFSKTNPEALFATSQFGAIRRSANGGNSMGRYMDQHIDSNQNGSPDCSAPFVTPFRLYEELRPDSLNLVWYQTHADEVIGDSLFVVGNDTTHVANIRKTYYGEGRMYLGTNCGTWVGTDALDFSMNPTWYHISFNATPASMELAPGGDIIYVGMSNGRLYRISGLLNANLAYVDSVFDLAGSGVKTTLLQNFGQYISGVAVDKHDPGHVVVSVGNYGNANYVFRSTVADTVGTVGSFTSIQGNLPRMPCYDVVIDYYNPNNVIVGTELGIYASDNLGVNWTYQGNGLPACPIFGLRQEMFRDLGGNCYILYAGTHGRGFYRSTTLTPTACNVNVSVSEPGPSQGFVIYPNPARDHAWLRLSLSETAQTELWIYNLSGQAVRRAEMGMLPGGGHNLPLPLSGLKPGQYLVVLRAGNDMKTQKLAVH